MPLEDSPSLEQYQEGLPEPAPSTRPPVPSRRRRARTWWAAIVVLMVAVAGLAVWNVLGIGAPANSEVGVGSVVGMVLGADGRPFAAEVMIEGTGIRAQVKPDGRFGVDSVPAGRRTVLINAMYVARSYPVTVHAGSTVDLGEIRLSGRVREGGYGRLEWR